MLDLLKSKIENYATQIENSVSNTTFLNTVKTELENVYNEFLSAAPAVESVATIVDPSAAPVIDAIVNDIETVTNAAQ
jgi:predicted ThiF/HesA family dinucleotide-utilizing enzyme